MAPKNITGEKSAPCSDPSGRSEPPKAEAKKKLALQVPRVAIKKGDPRLHTS